MIARADTVTAPAAPDLQDLPGRRLVDTTEPAIGAAIEPAVLAALRYRNGQEAGS